MMNDANFDTAILDIKMPDMDGLELAEQIRRRDEHLPIIFMTGFPSVDSAIAALRRRAEDYFVKPFNVKHMHKAVEAAIARSAGGAESEGTVS